MARMLMGTLLGIAMLLVGCGEPADVAPADHAPPPGFSPGEEYYAIYPIEYLFEDWPPRVTPGAERPEAYLSRVQLVESINDDIRTHVMPDSWQDEELTIRHYRGQLIIRQTLEVHQHIAAHLAMRREQMTSDRNRDHWYRTGRWPGEVYAVAYPVADLMVCVPDFIGPGGGMCFADEKLYMPTQQDLFQEFPDLIYEAIDPDSWDGFIRVDMTEHSYVLVVTQTSENHRRIAELLSKIRESRAERGSW
jgi:hypothetical protein